jgi:hypothetical protein
MDANVERLRIAVKTLITNSDGKETAGSEIFLGEMKLEDIKVVEKVLLAKIPQIFLDLLSQEG